jgi:D-cysteine desulfhydrase
VRDPALLRAFPGLRAGLPRHPAVLGATPVEPLPLPGAPRGALWIKRDERSCALYGGNKPRKLEWIVGHAVARGARRLVTTGGLGTNHGLATAILGRDAGLATTLVLIHQPITPAVRRSLALHAAWGARLVYGANVPGAAAQLLRVLGASALRGERPYLVAAGGSSARGSAGFVSAGLELAEQVREGRLPAPARIYVPVGTGGTLAGLVAGLRLAGLPARVVGVLVTDILPPNPARLAAHARATLRFLHRLDPRLPLLPIRPDDFDLVRDELGPGYGAATPAAERAVRVAAEAGLALETTYTGKCLAALSARLAEASADAPVLFWNTYNAVDVASRAPLAPDEGLLPPRLRRLLERA